MTTEKKIPSAVIASIFGAVCMFALMVASAFGGGSELTIAQEIAAAGGATNTAGNSVYAALKISDGTGVVTTPTDAGVATTVANTPMAAGEDDGSGCISASATTGKFTINACGAGDVELTACIGSLNAGNTAATATVAWSRTRSGSTSVVSPTAVKTEVVDAGTTSSLGCITYVDAASSGDTYQVTGAVSVNGAAITIKQANLMVKKIVN